ncbi:endonuclease/exonuclease/phosphatase family protein [Chitinophaga cymbidii]|uniref:Endonuclease n=1 Tax=Chitinophaga cymbidii TaxID=1096750 RepID=A0A512RL37_9BACT|nr:endonuclease/exonuclease/phosphatase family protein [Chitinophaga cymbidii]GEP96418.1 endonuclease [Chitinophaga cymbidii]
MTVNQLPRRGFIKGLGAASLLPFLPELAWSAAPAVPASHRVLSCNIRVALPEDEVKGVGWPDRKEMCIKIIKEQRPDIVCFQEVLKVQAEDIRKAFPKHCLFGFDGPEMDAHLAGYHGIAKNPVLFSTERYELLAGGCYWLSETPLVAGSMSWGTARARHANWIRLRERKTGKEFRVINLHLDHVSAEAKLQQAKMVVEECNQYQPDFPQLLAGDFNSRASGRVFEPVRAAAWTDSYAAVHGDKDPGYTAHAFEGANYAKGINKGKIDFIFYKGPVKALAGRIIKDTVNGKYPSDHYFLSADLAI